MNKRKWLAVLLLFVLFLLTGCMETTTDINGEKRIAQYGLIRIAEGTDIGQGNYYVAYDPKTRVCYITVSYSQQYGISPYYIIGEDGKPEIAVYGVNYGVKGGNDK